MIDEKLEFEGRQREKDLIFIASTIPESILITCEAQNAICSTCSPVASASDIFPVKLDHRSLAPDMAFNFVFHFFATRFLSNDSFWTGRV
jgi:hypothetical protein